MKRQSVSVVFWEKRYQSGSQVRRRTAAHTTKPQVPTYILDKWLNDYLRLCLGGRVNRFSEFPTCRLVSTIWKYCGTIDVVLMDYSPAFRITLLLVRLSALLSCSFCLSVIWGNAQEVQVCWKRCQWERQSGLSPGRAQGRSAQCS